MHINGTMLHLRVNKLLQTKVVWSRLIDANQNNEIGGNLHTASMVQKCHRMAFSGLWICVHKYGTSKMGAVVQIVGKISIILIKALISNLRCFAKKILKISSKTFSNMKFDIICYCLF